MIIGQRQKINAVAYTQDNIVIATRYCEINRPDVENSLEVLINIGIFVRFEKNFFGY